MRFLDKSKVRSAMLKRKLKNSDMDEFLGLPKGTFSDRLNADTFDIWIIRKIKIFLGIKTTKWNR